MQIILLSGGSGKRLWPLSNDARSKQFLRLIPRADGERESMLQRIARQIGESALEAEITVATSILQQETIQNQLGDGIAIVTEPERRDTFPAIALATSYLAKKRGCDRDEVVVVMPSDPFTEKGYFETIAKMARGVEAGQYEMMLMGIHPTEPSSKFGYIVPEEHDADGEAIRVKRFTEKPTVAQAQLLLNEHAVWNGGVFCFRLGYLIDIVERYIQEESYEQIHARYGELPKISFDYEVVERAESVGMVVYEGVWKDLGTWDSLCTQLDQATLGHVVSGEGTESCSIINELEIPIVALGAKDMIIAASPDGILVSDKNVCGSLKGYADGIAARPMYEERRWGNYKILGLQTYEDGYRALTKLLTIDNGAKINYHTHSQREEVWTVIKGSGLLTINGETREINRGDIAHFKAGQKHRVSANTEMQIIEVQTGRELMESDIIWFE